MLYLLASATLSANFCKSVISIARGESDPPVGKRLEFGRIFIIKYSFVFKDVVNVVQPSHRGSIPYLQVLHLNIVSTFHVDQAALWRPSLSIYTVL